MFVDVAFNLSDHLSNRTDVIIALAIPSFQVTQKISPKPLFLE